MFPQDKPQCLFLISFIIFVGLILAMLIGGTILEIRYFSPYTIRTSGKKEWRRAVILAFFQTGWIFIFGWIISLFNPDPEQWPVFPILCGGIWVIVFPVATLFLRWRFEWENKQYQYIDKIIKKGGSPRILTSPLISWTRIFMTSELKRFFREGYSESTNQKDEDSDT